MDNNFLPVKPCPFCGHAHVALEEHLSDQEIESYCVECACCGAHGPVVGSDLLAIKLWDNRGV